MTNKENESDDIITVEAVKDFLLKNNGKVKQSDLINEFRVHLSAPSTKVRARQEFKEILQLITAAKTENGEKYIILIKQAQEHFPSSVINRKAQRPMPARINHMKSRFDFLHLAERRTSNTTSDDEDSVSQHSSITIQSDSGISDLSRASVASSQSSLSYRMQCTPSMDSINTMLVEEEVGDLEDDIGLNDGLDMLAEEKEWMLAACHGNLNGLSSLLKAHPKLIHKKDFIMGYTALHWAAKLGRPDMVKYVISEGGDINCKSNMGYTPLHLAAASGHNQVIVQLIELYGANIHQRDHSGKKPKDIVKDTVAADVQRKLGRSLILEPDWVRSNAILERRGSLQNQHSINISPTMKPKLAKTLRQESVPA